LLYDFLAIDLIVADKILLC